MCRVTVVSHLIQEALLARVFINFWTFFFIFFFSPPKSHQGDKTCPSRHGGRQGDETVRFDAVRDDFDEFYLYGGCGRVAQVI